MKALRNKKKDEMTTEEKEFVARFFKAIDDNREQIAEAIEKERWKIREMSTIKPLDGLRKINV